MTISATVDMANTTQQLVFTRSHLIFQETWSTLMEIMKFRFMPLTIELRRVSSGI